MRRFVMGDIHGEYKHLVNVLKKSGFDYDKDLLIQLGDLVDRGSEPFKCIDELLKIKNTIFIKGNHDACFMEWFHSGKYNDLTSHPLGSHPFNGVGPTIKAWKELDLYDKHFILTRFFNKQVLYHITDDNIMFVHGGFPIDEKLEDIDDDTFMWDRDLVKLTTVGDQFTEGYVVPTIYGFKRIYLGHTPTVYWDKTEPMYGCGVWNVDTGCGKGGPLTIMDIDTGEYWQAGPKIQENDNKENDTEKQAEATETNKTNSGGEEEEKERDTEIGQRVTG